MAEKAKKPAKKARPGKKEAKHKPAKKAKPARHKPEKKEKPQIEVAEAKKEKDGLMQSDKAVKPASALILSFRRGRHTQHTNQFLLEVAGADTKAKASLFIGRRVVWTSPGKQKKQIFGKITTTHGNSGVLRARFSRGLPGTAVGTKVELVVKR